MEKTYICVACKKTVNNVPDFPDMQPTEAVVFTGRGAYGSGYDLSEELYVIVCDDCVTEALKTPGAVLVKATVQRPVYDYQATDTAYPNGLIM